MSTESKTQLQALGAYRMSIDQYTRDWDARFHSGDVPWEDEVVPPSTMELVHEYVPTRTTVLEIGFGRGTTAIWLSESGHQVVACDISAEAVRQARQRANAAGVEVRFLVLSPTYWLM